MGLLVSESDNRLNGERRLPESREHWEKGEREHLLGMLSIPRSAEAHIPINRIYGIAILSALFFPFQQPAA